MTDRVARLKARITEAVPSVDIHRARLVTRARRDAVGQPLIKAAAAAMYKLFTETPIAIGDDELIVGAATAKPRAALLYPEATSGWLGAELDKVADREWDPLQIDEETKRELREEILPFWEGKTIYHWLNNNLPAETRRVIFKEPDQFPSPSSAVIDNFSLIQKGIGTVVPNYAKILSGGVKAVVAEIEAALAGLNLTRPEDAAKRSFYEAALTTLDGLVKMAERYSRLAWNMAKEEKNPNRRRELEKIAEVCAHVPANRPRDFHEAVQCFWFIHLAVRLEESGHSLSPARFDQYMIEFYDPAEKDRALELIQCLFIKMSETMLFVSTDTSKFYTGVPQWQNLNLGGRTVTGRDATNALSYLCLEAMGELLIVQPDISVRIHADTPERFLLAAARLAAKGAGHPKFYNDDLIAHAMAAKGLTLEDSRNYSIMGCVEPRVTGKEGIHLTGGFINLPAAVEMTVNNGYCPFLGRTIGPETGDEFDTFDDFLAAYKAQLANLMDHMFVVNAVAQQAYVNYIASPFLSALTEGCIERGRSLQQGGALYNFGPAVNAIGIADTVDSLYSIKKAVFEDGLVGYARLKDALAADFDGAEDVRTMLLEDLPKFGNDIDEVDYLGREVIQFFNDQCMKHVNIFGGQAQGGIIPVTAGIPFGKITGALPSGRKAGEPYADGSSPSRGRDKGGPTAIVRSVAKLDLARLRNGDLLNMRLSPAAVATPEQLRKFCDFIRAFCDVGGWHIQFNVIDSALLRRAQAEPDKFSDLLVRVAGYSAYFTQLHKEVQEDIILRTEHML